MLGIITTNTCIYVKAYITWKDYTLRKWLNNSFYNTVFTAEEKRYKDSIT